VHEKVVAIVPPHPPSEVRAPVIAVARRWLAHQGSLFQLGDVHFGPVIDWHRDYASGISAPRRFSALINHRDGDRVGDVRYIWELNRMQHLVGLALAAVWTEEEAFAKEIVHQCRSWREQNPFLIGVSWKSPLEMGLRLVSWAYVATLARGIPRLDDFFREEMQQTLYQHQHFISVFHARHSSANNHLVGEMAGLYLASVVWPWFAETPRWKALARHQLHHAMAEQIEPDGVGKERAIEYQLFTIELFLAAAALGSLSGDPFSDSYWQRLAAMTSFIRTVSDHRGHFPRWGDGDGSRAVALPDTLPQRAAALSSCVGGKGEAETIRTVADLRLWLLRWGRDATDLPGSAPATARANTVTFPQGGYAVLSTAYGGEDEIIVAFDAGPLGLEPLAAHAHADALSIWVSLGGREFLVDPGTFSYYSAGPWREYFRGTGAHNTVRVDGVDQSIAGGRFLWRWAARCRLEAVLAGTECEVGGMHEVGGVHEGYTRLRDPLVHRRQLRLSAVDRCLWICDRLHCAGSHRVEIFFHFSAACSVSRTGDHTFVAEQAGQRLRINLDARTSAELLRGRDAPICGWESPAFGQKSEAWTLVARADIHGTEQFETLLKAERG
jgi:hypothetical protein